MLGAESGGLSPRERGDSGAACANKALFTHRQWQTRVCTDLPWRPWGSSREQWNEVKCPSSPRKRKQRVPGTWAPRELWTASRAPLPRDDLGGYSSRVRARQQKPGLGTAPRGTQDEEDNGVSAKNENLSPPLSQACLGGRGTWVRHL